jgi:hypothetical protein
MSKIKRGCCVAGCSERHEAKGYCQAHYKRWKLHGDPLINKRAPPGDGWIQHGYKYFTVNGKNTREHVIVVERAMGKPLPPGAIIHHVDEDRTNNAPTNLVVCPSHKYHHQLHQRMRAMDACGNPNWRKCPYCKQYDDPVHMRDGGIRFVHLGCRQKFDQERKRKREAAHDNHV